MAKMSVVLIGENAANPLIILMNITSAMQRTSAIRLTKPVSVSAKGMAFLSLDLKIKILEESYPASKSSNAAAWLKVSFTMDHFGITLAPFSKRGLVLDQSFENEFNLHVNENLLSYKRMSNRTRFENKAKRISEMGYLQPRVTRFTPCLSNSEQREASSIKFQHFLLEGPQIYIIV